MEQTTFRRQYDLDWIRVIATIGVFLYHCSMFVNPFPWHVKNNVTGAGTILVFSLFVGAWIMPIFFAVSGISITYTLKKRTFTQYVKERLKRLGIPLLFGVFILTPPQIYLERLANNQFYGSFFAFFPHFFEGVYLDFGGTGNFAFFGLHLWYLLVLLIFSLLSFPLLTIGKRNVRKIHFVLLPLILFATGFIHTQQLGGWDLIFYFILFLYGYYFLSSSTFKPALQATIKLQIGIALITSIVYITWFMIDYPHHSALASLFFAVRTLNCWSLLMCIFYLANKYLSDSNRFLTYGSEASLPFYILHQPIILAIGYFIRNLQWGIPAKLLFLVTVSFVVIMLCYHFVIRRVPVFRFLFGMKRI